MKIAKMEDHKIQFQIQKHYMQHGGLLGRNDLIILTCLMPQRFTTSLKSISSAVCKKSKQNVEYMGRWTGICWNCKQERDPDQTASSETV